MISLSNYHLSQLNVQIIKDYLKIDKSYIEDDMLLDTILKVSLEYILRYLGVEIEDIDFISVELNIACIYLVSYCYVHKSTHNNSKDVEATLIAILSKYKTINL